MAETRRKFDPEFREGAVRIVREITKSISQVARDLGINAGTLGNWVAHERAGRDGTQGLSTDDVAKLKRLRREVAELRMERDVLKRSVVRGQGGDDVSVARFVADQRTMHQVPHVFCCRILDLSVSWFYKWLGREPTDRQVRAASSTTRSRRRSTLRAAPMVHCASMLTCSRTGAVSVNTVADFMRRQGLQGRKPKHRKRLTKQDATVAKFPDLLHRDFTAPAPNVRWCGDITEIPTDEGKLYL